jgi:acyl-CoA thioesterase
VTGGAATSDPAAGPAEPSLDRMLAVFDVTPTGPGSSCFAGTSSDGGRNVIDGSQFLAQSIVAAAKALPGRTVRSATALFVAAASPAEPLEFTVTTVRAGRSFANALVTAGQGDRTCATATVLLDYPQPDVIRHDHPADPPLGGPPSAGPEAAHPAPMPLRGRELRIEGVRDHNSPDEIGPPVLDAWLRYDVVPERDDLRGRCSRTSPVSCPSPPRCGHTRGSAPRRPTTPSPPR